MSAPDNTLLRASGLWAKSSAKGRSYVTGRLGGLRVLIFENRDPDRGENAPTHWLMLGQAEDRRPRSDQEGGR